MRSPRGARPDAPALKAFMRERLAPRTTPTFWIWIEDWPLTGSGEIQKFRLREEFERGAFDDQTGARR